MRLATIPCILYVIFSILLRPILAEVQWEPMRRDGAFWAGTEEQQIFWTIGLFLDICGFVGFVMLYREVRRNELLRSTSVQSFYPMFLGNFLFLCGTLVVYSANYFTLLRQADQNGCAAWGHKQIPHWLSTDGGATAVEEANALLHASTGISSALWDQVQKDNWYGLSHRSMKIGEITDDIAQSFNTTSAALTLRASSLSKDYNSFLYPVDYDNESKYTKNIGLDYLMFVEWVKEEGNIEVQHIYAYTNCTKNSWRDRASVITQLFDEATNLEEHRDIYFEEDSTWAEFHDVSEHTTLCAVSAVVWLMAVTVQTLGYIFVAFTTMYTVYVSTAHPWFVQELKLPFKSKMQMFVATYSFITLALGAAWAFIIFLGDNGGAFHGLFCAVHDWNKSDAGGVLAFTIIFSIVACSFFYVLAVHRLKIYGGDALTKAARSIATFAGKMWLSFGATWGMFMVAAVMEASGIEIDAKFWMVAALLVHCKAILDAWIVLTMPSVRERARKIQTALRKQGTSSGTLASSRQSSLSSLGLGVMARSRGTTVSSITSQNSDSVDNNASFRSLPFQEIVVSAGGNVYVPVLVGRDDVVQWDIAVVQKYTYSLDIKFSVVFEPKKVRDNGSSFDSASSSRKDGEKDGDGGTQKKEKKKQDKVRSVEMTSMKKGEKKISHGLKANSVTLVSPQRIEEHQGFVCAHAQGVVVLCFDNSFSRVLAKTVRYIVSNGKKEEEDEARIPFKHNGSNESITRESKTSESLSYISSEIIKDESVLTEKYISPRHKKNRNTEMSSPSRSSQGGGMSISSGGGGSESPRTVRFRAVEEEEEMDNDEFEDDYSDEQDSFDEEFMYHTHCQTQRDKDDEERQRSMSLPEFEDEVHVHVGSSKAATYNPATYLENT
eukprot:g5169.t1